MAENESLNERAGSLNFDNCSMDSSPNYRRNNNIRKIACVLLTTITLITFVSILVIGITHKSHVVGKSNSTSSNLSSLEYQMSKINISVYYEVYSAKSRDFIVNHLVPVQQKYDSYINIRYLAFGKVTIFKEIQGNYIYECKKGHVECYAAELHVCLQQRFSTYTDQSLLTSIIACSINKYNFLDATFDTITKITHDCINKYAARESAQNLLCSNALSLINHNHNEAMLLKPQLKFLPTVTIDGVQLSEDQILRAMDTVVCEAINKQTEINC